MCIYRIGPLNKIVYADKDCVGGSFGITVRSRDERWQDDADPINLGLSQTGNWLRHLLDLNGDGVFTGSGELNETSDFSLANELLTRDLNSNSTVDYTLAHDKAGNMTEDGQGYHYTYDAFGRLTRIWTGAKTIALYRYNGLGHRIAWRYDSNADTEIDGDDPWYFFCYDERWRVVATFRADDEHPKEVFVHHNAGLGGGVGGMGGSSYIDSVIFRDRDIIEGWTDEADEVRGERLYYFQNWRADVSAILTDTGSLVEWVKYSVYGVPFSLPASDTDSNGTYDLTDRNNIDGWTTGYDVRYDANLDGVIDKFDDDHAASITGGYQTLGRGVLSSSAINNRRGYAAYEYDPTLEGEGRWLYHVRHRVYDAEVGRWTRRDPLGYVDGLSLYEYVRGMAVVGIDPSGTTRLSCKGCNPLIARNPMPDTGMPGDPGFPDANPELVPDRRPKNPERIRPWRRDVLLPIPVYPVYPIIVPAEVPITIPGWSGIGHCFFCMPSGRTIGWGPNGWEVDHPDDQAYCDPYGDNDLHTPAYETCLWMTILSYCVFNTGTTDRFCPFDPYSYPSNDCNDGCTCMRRAYWDVVRFPCIFNH